MGKASGSAVGQCTSQLTVKLADEKWRATPYALGFCRSLVVDPGVTMLNEQRVTKDIRKLNSYGFTSLASPASRLQFPMRAPRLL